jgi:hypothetical protein
MFDKVKNKTCLIKHKYLRLNAEFCTSLYLFEIRLEDNLLNAFYLLFMIFFKKNTATFISLLTWAFWDWVKCNSFDNHRYMRIVY